MVRFVMVVGVVVLHAACGGGTASYECSAESTCVQGGFAGECRLSTESDRHWCAYPDDHCGSGERWGVLAGDGLASECVAGEAVIDGGPDATIDASVDATPAHYLELTVTLAGSGATSGRVVSSPAGIDCPGTCTAKLPPGAVELSVTGAPLLGWSGPCASPLAATCAFDLASASEVTGHLGTSGKAEWLAVLAESGQNPSTGQSLVLPGGDVAFAYTYVGTASFAGVTLPESGSKSFMLIARVDPLTGKPRWTRVLGGMGSKYIRRLAASPAGDLFLLGDFSELFDTGIEVHEATGSETYLISLAGGDGATRWARFFPANDAYASGLAVDSTGDVYMAATIRTIMPLGGNDLFPEGISDAAVARFAGDSGNHVWSKTSKAIGEDVAGALGVDAADNLLLAGSFVATTRFFGGTTQISATQGLDIFAVKLRGENGENLSAIVRSGPIDDTAYDVVIGDDGFAYVTWSEFEDGFFSKYTVTKLTAVGSVAWERQLIGDMLSPRLAQRGDSLWVAGGFAGTLALDGVSLTSMGSNDAFLARLATNDGKPSAAWRTGGTGSDLFHAVTVGLAGQVFLSGSFQGLADLFGQEAESAAGRDPFLLSFTP